MNKIQLQIWLYPMATTSFNIFLLNMNFDKNSQPD